MPMAKPADMPHKPTAMPAPSWRKPVWRAIFSLMSADMMTLATRPYMERIWAMMAQRLKALAHYDWRE